ncbi:hypothetical protein O9X98_05840 [Agrobacterium salinitolerans]|nr:hypothetical protein [Agrobacterium salinitolerans]
MWPLPQVGHSISVIRDAMAAEGMIGISRLVISRRERAVMIEPRGKGIVLWTLRYGDEVSDKAEYFAGPLKERAEAEAEPLVDQFIKQETRHWSSSIVADPVQKKLLQLVELKRRQQRPAPIKTKPLAPGVWHPGVVNIMDALRKSLDADNKKAKSRPGQTH